MKARGRPTRIPGEKATEVLRVIVTRTERRVLESDARRNGQKPSSYLRDLVVTKAGDLLEE